MRPILIDKIQNTKFEEKGYVVIPSFLNSEEIGFFYDFYIQKKTENKINAEGLYNPDFAEFSIIHSLKEFREEVFQLINGKLQPRLSRILDRCKPIVTNYIMKEPGGKGSVPVHQNWSLVDEEIFKSVSVWISLVDADDMNGTLEFVDGSHTMFRGKRGSWGSHNFVDAEPLIKEKFLTKIPVRAGDCIILDDSIIHYSRPNNSDSIRLSMQIIMIPEEAQGYYYYKSPEEKGDWVDVYAVDEKYFFEFENWLGKHENCRYEGKIKVNIPYYTEQQFLDKYLHKSKSMNSKNPFNRFYRIFK